MSPSRPRRGRGLTPPTSGRSATIAAGDVVLAGFTRRASTSGACAASTRPECVCGRDGRRRRAGLRRRRPDHLAVPARRGRPRVRGDLRPRPHRRLQRARGPGRGPRRPRARSPSTSRSTGSAPISSRILPHLTVACFSASDLDEEAALEPPRRRRGPRTAARPGHPRAPSPALLFDGRRTWRQPVVGVVVVDTLGAGDSFIGRVPRRRRRRRGPGRPSSAAAAEAAARTCGDFGAFGHGRPFAPRGVHERGLGRVP